MPSAPSRLIFCESLDAYAEVAAAFDPARRQVPVLGRPARVSGFGRGVECVPQAQWCREAGSWRPPEPSPSRVCVTIDEPSCAAVTRFLARATGRSARVLPAAADEWARGLDRLVEQLGQAGPLDSVAFVVPLWAGEDGGLDPSWLGRVLAHVRTRHGVFEHVAWGIVTGVDPRTLSLVAAKAVLQDEIIAAYAEAPATMFANASADTLDSRLPPMIPEGRADTPVQLVERSHVRAGLARTLTRQPWSLLYFRGHGRFYCGNEGHLCGARPIHAAPDAPVERCVDGLSCASPHDGSYDAELRAFPRIDPRSYDTPVMVIDSCAAGGWSSPDWAEGRPSIAIHALCGAPSAVVCGDYVTTGTTSAHVEVFACLWTAETIGAAVSRLNRARPDAVAEFAYFLLGDPECPVGRTRWPSWCAEPLSHTHERTPSCQHIHASVPLATPFVRVPLELAGARETTSFVRCDDPEVELHSLHLLADEHPELWLSVERAAGGATQPAALEVETHPTPRLPPGLLDAALSVPLLVRSWSAELAAGAGPLLAAAEEIEKLADLLAKLRGRALRSNPDEILSSVLLCRHTWLRAQLAALEHALSLAEGGLWPFRLWRARNYGGRTCPDPCPHCGVAPTLHREYDSPPLLRRRQWECVACALILDRPLLPMPKPSLAMPTRLGPGETIRATLHFDNREGEGYFAVAGALLLDRKGHGVAPPPPFVFEIGPGEERVEEVELHLEAPPPIAHRYYARAPLVINGMWSLATRLLTIHA